MEREDIEWGKDATARRRDDRPVFVDCTECPLRQNSLFRPLEGEELQFVRSIKYDQLSYQAGEEMVHAGDADCAAIIKDHLVAKLPDSKLPAPLRNG
ncbi:hypothetical protein HMF7854_07590 [Sphingomonas ginkgonis]|uniref:Uncharacterized protein n=1 Tax=Sphingomonas ginkgonis TaxID=2315330 RepID=A0A3S0EM65_9SPHN|nr:hypothetical protein [Sphingomonas ginkgonis]RST30710.1 hypothetical protein HMF7854_07590 [Sphingomonas ginkgonis]